MVISSLINFIVKLLYLSIVDFNVMIIKKTLSLVVFFAFFILASISPIFGAIPIEGSVFDVHIEALDESIPTIEDSPILPELPVIVDEDVMPVPYAYYDYDNDGKTDLVRKEVDGNYYVYKNKGTNENKIFREGTKISNLEGNNLIENYAPQTTSSVTGTASPQGWLFFSHPRYDLYIDDAYYNANGNGPLLDDFFNEFDERYALLESITGWSSEKYSVFGTKLKINVSAAMGCSSGSAYLGNIYLQLSNPLYLTGCERPYYENSVPFFGNPGELGDNWRFMETTIHESIHAINPPVIQSRRWLTEGFGRYHEYNVLSNYNGNGFKDINQETANTYLFLGSESNNYNWTTYLNNDYRDGLNLEIQLSHGYAITAWMFSMMRDNHSLNWNNFYNLLENNKESQDKAFQLSAGSVYNADMFIIDLFGRASGLDFETQTKPIWRYDGPSGPGWGVRNWEALDWYADLRVPYLNFSDTNGNIFYMGENVTINANVSNTGQVNLQGVVVRIYEGANLLKEQIININAETIVPISVNFHSSTASSYNIRVVVDEDDIKIELNDSNNENTKVLSFQPAKCGDLDNSGAIDVLDVVNMVNVAFRGQPQGNNPTWVWDVDASGAIDIIDVVKIVNVAFRGANVTTELSCNEPVPNVQASTTITLQKISGGFSASASIDRNVAGMQFDLSYDSSKFKISEVKTTTRTSGMTITNTQISSGKNRIAIYSDNGEKFIKSGQGTLFTVQATGNDFSSLKIIPKVVDYKTSNAFSNVKVSYKFKTTTRLLA